MFLSLFFEKCKTEKEVRNARELLELKEIANNLPKDVNKKALIMHIDSEIEKIKETKKYRSSTFLNRIISDYKIMKDNDMIQYLIKFKILVTLRF